MFSWNRERPKGTCAKFLILLLSNRAYHFQFPVFRDGPFHFYWTEPGLTLFRLLTLAFLRKARIGEGKGAMVKTGVRA
jgi:hypothetical protein